MSQWLQIELANFLDAGLGPAQSRNQRGIRDYETLSLLAPQSPWTGRCRVRDHASRSRVQGPGSKARNQRTVSSDESCVLEGLDMGVRILVFTYRLSNRLVDDVIEKYSFSHGPRPRILLRRASDFSPTVHSQFCVRPGRRSGLRRYRGGPGGPIPRSCASPTDQTLNSGQKRGVSDHKPAQLRDADHNLVKSILVGMLLGATACGIFHSACLGLSDRTCASSGSRSGNVCFRMSHSQILEFERHVDQQGKGVLLLSHKPVYSSSLGAQTVGTRHIQLEVQSRAESRSSSPAVPYWPPHVSLLSVWSSERLVALRTTSRSRFFPGCRLSKQENTP